MRVSTNFSRSEFSCKCGCGFEAVDIVLVNVLEKVRKYMCMNFGECFIDITSGNRCSEHNKKVGGAENSKHISGIAVDFKVFKKDTYEQIPEKIVYNYLEIHYPNTFGIGRYSNRTHLDVREERARWDYRK